MENRFDEHSKSLAGTREAGDGVSRRVSLRRLRRPLLLLAGGLACLALAAQLAVRAYANGFSIGPLIQVSKDPDPLAGCDTGFRPAGNMNFDDEYETRIAVDPSNPSHLVATWVGHDLQANFVGVSFDGGATWQENALPGITTCTGGPYDLAVDPYLLSIAPNGDIFVASVGASAHQSAILVNKSTDGGLTWATPITIDQSNNKQLMDDKPSTTADPSNPLIAYVIFERIIGSFGSNSTAITLFSRTTDGGRTWDAAREIADPGNQNVNTGHKVLVLPDGSLVAFFTHEENHTPSGGTYTTSLATLRSADHGETWPPRPGRSWDPRSSPLILRIPRSEQPIRTPASCLTSSRPQSLSRRWIRAAAQSTRCGRTAASARASTTASPSPSLPTAA